MKVLKKAITLVFVLVLALSCVMGVFAQDVSATENDADTFKGTSFSSHTYTFNDKEYKAERPEGVKVDTHIYYVGEIKGRAEDDTDDGTLNHPFKTLHAAITQAQKDGYLKYDQNKTKYENYLVPGAVIDEVKIVLVGDTHETNILPRIQAGIFTIVSDIDATIYVGSDNPNALLDGIFMYIVPYDGSYPGYSKEGYIEVNLGTPDMKGTVTFDCTYYKNTGGDWGGLIRVNEDGGTVAILNMYNGVTIKNISYDENYTENGEKVGKILATGNGAAILIDTGTFNMYGGTFTQNSIKAMVRIYNRNGGGAGAFIYGGKFIKNNGMAFFLNNNGPKLVIYDVSVRDNYFSDDTAILHNYTGSVAIYGGEFINNMGSKASINASNMYIDFSKFNMQNETFTGLDGKQHTCIDYNGNSGKSINAKVFYAKDGSATAYGYCSSNNTYLNDIQESDTPFTQYVTAGEGEGIYLDKGPHFCKDEPIFYDKIEINANMESGIYYFDKAANHTLDGKSKIEYPNGFDNNGIKSTTCSVCAKEVVVDENLAPILISKGYAVAKDGSAIIGGYKVDYDALGEFEDINQTTLEYGVLFVNVNNENVDEITFENGVIQTSDIIRAIQKRVNTNYTDDEGNKYDSFNYKVSNFVPSETKYADLAIVIAAYVIEREKTGSKTELGEIKNISFVQSNPASEENEETLAISDDAGEVDSKGFKYQKTVSVTGQNVKEGTTLGAVTLRNLYQNSEYAGTNDPFTKTED